MVMPFEDELAETAYRYITKPVVESMGLRIVRADEIFSTNPIHSDIVTAIKKSAIVAVDISGKNPNCFYELGMAHLLKPTRTLMITHDEYDEAPFDIAHFRIIQYRDSIEGRVRFEEHFRKTLVAITTGLGSIYETEYSVAITALELTEFTATLIFAIGLQETSVTIDVRERLAIEGCKPDGNIEATISANADEYISILAKLGYARVDEHKISLTDKGQGFVNYLVATGFKCHGMNDEIFTPGHTTYWDIMKEGNFSSITANQPAATESKGESSD